MKDDPRGRRLNELHWGLIPTWAKDPSIGSRMINARAETAAEKPVFRTALRRRRCLVPADAFYEWKKLAEGKQPYCIRKKDGSPLALAGLWEWWKPTDDGDDDEVIRSFAILTTTANALMKKLHDRMPVIIQAEDFDAWLDPNEQDATKVSELLKPLNAKLMEAYPVSRHVNSPRNDDARCMKCIEIDEAGEKGSDASGLFG